MLNKTEVLYYYIIRGVTSNIKYRMGIGNGAVIVFPLLLEYVTTFILDSDLVCALY